MYKNSYIKQTCHWWRFQTGPNNLSSDTLLPRPFGDRVTNMFAQLLFYKHIIVISPKENYTHSLSLAILTFLSRVHRHSIKSMTLISR